MQLLAEPPTPTETVTPILGKLIWVYGVMQVSAEDACHMCRHEWMRQALQCYLKRQGCQAGVPSSNGGPPPAHGAVL